MKKYLLEIIFLLGDEIKKLPWLVILFISSSFFDLAGLGLIGPYVGLIVNPDSLAEGRIHDLVESMGLPLELRPLLILIGLVLISIFLLKGAAAIYINRLILVFSNRQVIRLKSFLMQAYQHMPYGDYLNRNSAEYIIMIQNHASTFGLVMTNGLKLISEGLVGLAILIMLAWNNGPALGLLVFLIGGLVLGYDRFFRRNIRIFGVRASNASTLAVKGIHEGIEGLKEIRILGKEKHFHQVVKINSEEATDNQIKSQIISTAPRYLLEFILVVFVVGMVVGSILMGQDLKTLIPTLGIFGVASLRLMPSANIISSGLMQLRYSRHSISLLYSDLKKLEQLDLNIKVPPTPLKAKDDFRDFVLLGISFIYPNTKSPALKNLSLKIRTGESIGLIGPSGSGKTTLVDVLLGLLEPQEGELYYNGIPLKDSLAEWRSQIAYLPQEVFLIDNTLRHNVALGMEDKEIDDLLVEKALHQARLDELVEQLPQGIETMLGERGVRLSGGQRQRVALARAFYYGCKVLVMDEATSSLDNETELEIVEEIKHHKGEITMIVIAHRLTTVQDCDQIYKLKNGRIVDSGDYGKVVFDKMKRA